MRNDSPVETIDGHVDAGDGQVAGGGPLLRRGSRWHTLRQRGGASAAGSRPVHLPSDRISDAARRVAGSATGPSRRPRPGWRRCRRPACWKPGNLPRARRMLDGDVLAERHHRRAVVARHHADWIRSIDLLLRLLAAGRHRQAAVGDDDHGAGAAGQAQRQARQRKHDQHDGQRAQAEQEAASAAGTATAPAPAG